MEVFKDIPNFEGLYMVSNLGRVKSLTKKLGNRTRKEVILKHRCSSSRPYKLITLSKKGVLKTFTVHSLIAEAFLNYKRGGKMVIDHIDNNPENNNLKNLQIITKSQNSIKNKKPRGSSKYLGVTKRFKKFRATFRGNYLGTFKTEKVAAAVYQYELKKYLKTIKI